MSGSAEVSVVQEAAGHFRVEVHDAGVTTSHTVSVPDGLADELGWSREGEIELVRESFVFLLEREPPTSILRRFSLEVIGRYFPDYPTEIRKRAPERRARSLAERWSAQNAPPRYPLCRSRPATYRAEGRAISSA